MIVTTAQTVGTGLLIDTQKACKVYVREGITSRVGTNNDDLTKNLYRMVLEECLVLGVTRPATVHRQSADLLRDLTYEVH